MFDYHNIKLQFSEVKEQHGKTFEEIKAIGKKMQDYLQVRLINYYIQLWVLPIKRGYYTLRDFSRDKVHSFLC